MSSANNGLIAKNTFFLFARMLLLMVISLYTSRVVLRYLGVEDFGIYNVVGSIVFIFSSLSTSMNAASNRYIILSLTKQTILERRKTFSAVFFIHLIIGVFIFVLVEIVGLYMFNTKLVIPENRLNAAFWIFQLTAVSVILLFINYPYNSLIIAYERMNVFALLSIIDALLRLGGAFLLPFFDEDKLIVFGLLTISVQVTIQFIYVLYCKKEFPEAKLQISVDCILWKNMLAFVGWIFVGNFAFVTYNQGVNILLNMFFGPTVNAARAIAVQVQSAFSRFIDSFQTALKPQITLSYTNAPKRFESLISVGLRISFVLMSAMLLPFVFFMDEILELWLVEVPESTNIFIFLLLAISFIRGISNPIMVAIQANGSIRGVQLMEAFFLILVLPVSYILLKIYDLPAWSVFLSSLFFETITLGGRVLMVIPKIKLKYSFFLKDVLCPIVEILLVSFIIPLYSIFICHEERFLAKTFSLIVSEVVVFGAFYLIGLKNIEREKIRKKLCSYLRMGKK